MTGIVLAGGRSTRMGTDKAWLDWNGRPLVARVAAALRAAGCTEVLAVGGHLARLAQLGLSAIPDPEPGEGPLPALAAGLRAARGPLVLAVACDMPHLNPRALALTADLAPGHDAVVPWLDPRGWEPLHAAYRRSCLPAIQERLAAGERKTTCFYPDVDVRKMTRAELVAVDPDLLTVVNVNTPADVQRARPMRTRR